MLDGMHGAREMIERLLSSDFVQPSQLIATRNISMHMGMFVIDVWMIRHTLDDEEKKMK